MAPFLYDHLGGLPAVVFMLWLFHLCNIGDRMVGFQWTPAEPVKFFPAEKWNQETLILFSLCLVHRNMERPNV